MLSDPPPSVPAICDSIAPIVGSSVALARPLAAARASKLAVQTWGVPLHVVQALGFAGCVAAGL